MLPTISKTSSQIIYFSVPILFPDYSSLRRARVSGSQALALGDGGEGCRRKTLHIYMIDLPLSFSVSFSHK